MVSVALKNRLLTGMTVFFLMVTGIFLSGLSGNGATEYTDRGIHSTEVKLAKTAFLLDSHCSENSGHPDATKCQTHCQLHCGHSFSEPMSIASFTSPNSGLVWVQLTSYKNLQDVFLDPSLRPPNSFLS